ncbi:hypothetical protein GDO81_021806 [Engystomops pustulosus]|uniref:EF-hand domain-containing protein n=2 Tax=Engystomops pustulosus TaxID=76066 RepID=A0AAV6ZG17_ENGPU|nr:hypothetical protein GDO81_021806 [Engystomops pustulosus]
MEDLLSSYRKFAKMEGNPETINLNEFREYVKAEIPTYLESKDPHLLENTMASLDVDKDGELQYKEFFSFITQYIVASYNANNKVHRYSINGS